jgi:hypothetical protein
MKCYQLKIKQSGFQPFVFVKKTIKEVTDILNGSPLSMSTGGFCEHGDHAEIVIFDMAEKEIDALPKFTGW